MLLSGEFGTVNPGLCTDVCADPVQVAVKTLNSQCSESDGEVSEGGSHYGSV